MLVTLEGIDGIGKSSVHHLLKWKYPSAFFTHEPFEYNRVHKAIENTLAYDKLLIFMQDRLLHTQLEIIHHYNGELIICDRYMLSNILYQGYYIAKEINMNGYYEPTDSEPYQKMIYDMHIPEYFVHPDLTIVLYTNWDVENEVKERIRKECDGDEDLYTDLGYINDDYMRSSYAYVKNKLVHICVDGRTPEEMCELVKREIDEVMKNDR